MNVVLHGTMGTLSSFFDDGVRRMSEVHKRSVLGEEGGKKTPLEPMIGVPRTIVADAPPGSLCEESRSTMTDSEPIPPELLERTIQVFGNEKKARRWLTRSHAELGSSPVSMARTDGGQERVLDLLGRIEHGVYG